MLRTGFKARTLVTDHTKVKVAASEVLSYGSSQSLYSKIVLCSMASKHEALSSTINTPLTARTTDEVNV